MLTSMDFLGPIVVAMLLLAMLVSWVFFKTPAATWLKYALVPSLLGAALFSWSLFITKLGYAIPVQLPQASVRLIEYHVVIKDYKKVGIELWVKEKADTRLYSIPYSKETEKQLKEAQKQAKQGGGQLHIKPKKKGKGGSSQETDGIETEILTPSQIMPKDAPAEEEIEEEQAPKALPPGVRGA